MDTSIPVLQAPAVCVPFALSPSTCLSLYMYLSLTLSLSRSAQDPELWLVLFALLLSGGGQESCYLGFISQFRLLFSF